MSDVQEESAQVGFIYKVSKFNVSKEVMMMLISLSESDSQNSDWKIMVKHDFSRGPWWPEDTVDAILCVEVLEHVGKNFEKNYLATFKKAPFIFVTHSN